MKTNFAAIVAAIALSVPLFAAAPEPLRKAPDFTFSLPGKGPQSLSDMRGKVVALEFIFTTCPHCQAASKVMSKLQEEFGPKGLQVVDVAINPNADLLVENFAKDYKVNFPVGWAPVDQMTSFMGFASTARYVVPQLVLIDRKGMIHYQTPPTENDDWDNLMKEENVRAHIQELLALGSARESSATRKKSAGGVALAPRGQ